MYKVSFLRYMHRPINPEDPPGVPQPKPAYPYRTVGCVFNDEKFYANSQVGIWVTKEELENWVTMYQLSRVYEN